MTQSKPNPHVILHPHKVTPGERAAQKHQTPALIWFTGLSGSGKSTLANEVEHRLSAQGRHTYLLDGDNLRTGLNHDLGFGREARAENIRRAGEVARLMLDAGLLTLAAFVSPYRADRDAVRARVAPYAFIEVYVRADLATCQARDPKGLHQKAVAGEIKNFTGLTQEYEAPEAPELVVDTSQLDLDTSAELVLAELKKRGIA